jgi:transposase
MAKVEGHVKQWLEAGLASGHKKTQKTCQNILGLWPSLWTFVKVEGVESTNNAAVRALRGEVL